MESAAPWQGLGTRESYLRVAATAVYGYDLLVTIPRELAFYRRQRRWRPSAVCLYFVVTRYATLVYLATTQAGFFTVNFSPSLCRHWVLVNSGFRQAGMTGAALIFLWRTTTVWPARWVKVVLWASLLAAFGVITSTIFRAQPRSLAGINNCANGGKYVGVPAYVNWLLWAIFDLLAFGLLWLRLARDAGGARLRFSTFLWWQSLGYVFASLLVYVAQAVLLTLPAELGVATMVASLAAALNSILAQRLVISLSEHRERHADGPASDMLDAGALRALPILSPGSPRTSEPPIAAFVPILGSRPPDIESPPLSAGLSSPKDFLDVTPADARRACQLNDIAEAPASPAVDQR